MVIEGDQFTHETLHSLSLSLSVFLPLSLSLSSSLSLSVSLSLSNTHSLHPVFTEGFCELLGRCSVHHTPARGSPARVSAEPAAPALHLLPSLSPGRKQPVTFEPTVPVCDTAALLFLVFCDSGPEKYEAGLA